MGNQSAQQLLRVGVIQAKLTVNQPGDRYEQEADHVADAVMRMPESRYAKQTSSGMVPAVQRICSECEEELHRAPGGIQRLCSECRATSNRDPDFQAEELPGQLPEVTPAAQNQIEAMRGGGRPLPDSERAFFEPRFGRDFSNVRVHTDTTAAESARQMHALAYTLGRDIVFGAGGYRPDTDNGRRLMAHELTHVIQQQGSNHSTPAVQRVCGETDIAAAVGGRSQCADRFGGRFLPGLPTFKFNSACDDWAAGEDAALQTFAAGLPAAATMEIHGFASPDGRTSFNQNLGCARALKAFSVLTTADPAHGFPGISASRISAVINHGPVPAGSEPVANLRSVVIRTLGVVLPTPPPAGLQTVTIPASIRGAATPAAMTQNRIPPRVDTPVTVSFTGAPSTSTPVTLAIEGGGGGNGSATVDGAATAAFAVTGATVVNLRGVDQTLDAAHAGNLRLVARQRGTQIGASNGFSVSSIPVSMSHPFNRLITDADCPTFGFAAGCGFRGMIVDQNMDSDSTVSADLDRADESERIQLVSATGRFAGASLSTGCYVPCVPSPPDFHGQPGLAGASSAGVITLRQTFMFRDNRTGASEIPMADSGFIITFDVAPIPGTGFLGFGQSFQLTVSSIGTAASATDPNPRCPSGTITSAAGRTSVTKIVPL